MEAPHRRPRLDIVLDTLNRLPDEDMRQKDGWGYQPLCILTQQVLRYSRSTLAGYLIDPLQERSGRGIFVVELLDVAKRIARLHPLRFET